MTFVKITGSHEDLEIIETLSTEFCRESKVTANIKIAKFRADSIESEQILPILSVTFSGVIAIVQIVNLVLNIQDRKSKANALKDVPISISIKASNGRELDLKISGDLTDTEIKRYLDSTQTFADAFLQNDDGFSLGKGNSRQEEKINQEDIVKVNLLFSDLLDRLSDIRELKSLPPKKHGEMILYNSTFNKIGLKEFIFDSRVKKVYLNDKEVDSCKGIFYVLERENVLGFHEFDSDFHVIDMENMYVRHEIEELPFFKKITSHKDFILSNMPYSSEE